MMKKKKQSNKQKINNKVEINDKLGPQDSEPKNNEENKQIENPHQQAQHGQHHHSNPQDQPQKQPIQNGENKIKVPPQYIIQKKVLVTDPKTGKQGYIIKSKSNKIKQQPKINNIIINKHPLLKINNIQFKKKFW